MVGQSRGSLIGETVPAAGWKSIAVPTLGWGDWLTRRQLGATDPYERPTMAIEHKYSADIYRDGYVWYWKTTRDSRVVKRGLAVSRKHALTRAQQAAEVHKLRDRGRVNSHELIELS